MVKVYRDRLEGGYDVVETQKGKVVSQQHFDTKEELDRFTKEKKNER